MRYNSIRNTKYVENKNSARITKRIKDKRNNIINRKETNLYIDLMGKNANYTAWKFHLVTLGIRHCQNRTNQGNKRVTITPSQRSSTAQVLYLRGKATSKKQP